MRAQLRDTLSTKADGTTLIGLVTSITAEGRPLVDYPGNAGCPIFSRSIVTELDVGSSVLLMFENNDPAAPIIIGVVRETVVDRSKRSKNTVIECNRLTVVAREEIGLHCSTTSLIMRKDGKVITKGKEVVSRASRTNKVQGSSVHIN